MDQLLAAMIGLFVGWILAILTQALSEYWTVRKGKVFIREMQQEEQGLPPKRPQKPHYVG